MAEKQEQRIVRGMRVEIRPHHRRSLSAREKQKPTTGTVVSLYRNGKAARVKRDGTKSDGGSIFALTELVPLDQSCPTYQAKESK